jgi:hypothetical protein
LPLLMCAGFIAESGRWKRVENVRARLRLAIGVGPGEIRVKKLGNRSSVTFGSGLDKFAVGLKGRGFLGRGSSLPGER